MWLVGTVPRSRDRPGWFAEFLVAGEAGAEGGKGEEVFGFAFVAQDQAR
jgi:hypothetical protein